MHELFHKIAKMIADVVGSAQAFIFALCVVLIWAALGPVFHFSSGWQLVINTATTILTFLIVFLIQNTQNRDAKAMQLKLDELIKSGPASDSLIDLEDKSDEDLNRLELYYKNLSDKVAKHRSRRNSK